jgi:hypothetical protein
MRTTPLTPERLYVRTLAAPALCGQRFPRAGAAHARDRVALRLGDQRPVLGLDRDLPGHVRAPGGAVGWQPGRGVGVAFGLVGGPRRWLAG